MHCTVHFLCHCEDELSPRCGRIYYLFRLGSNTTLSFDAIASDATLLSMVRWPAPMSRYRTLAAIISLLSRFFWFNIPALSGCQFLLRAGGLTTNPAGGTNDFFFFLKGHLHAHGVGSIGQLGWQPAGLNSRLIAPVEVANLSASPVLGNSPLVAKSGEKQRQGN